MRSAIKSQLQYLNVVVRRVLVDPIPHGVLRSVSKSAADVGVPLGPGQGSAREVRASVH